MNTAAIVNVGSLDKSASKEEIEVTLFWGKANEKNALVTKHLAFGSAVKIGESEGCDFAVPREAIDADLLEIVSFINGEVIVNPPANGFVFVDRLPRQASPFVLARGHVVDMEMGAFSMRISVGEAAAKIPVELVSKIQESGWGTIGFSAVVHASLLAAFAFFMPSLGQADEEGINRDQMLSMQAFISNAEEREREVTPTETTNDGQGSPSDSGQRAANDEGAMGGAKPIVMLGHWSAKGDTPRESATLAREHALNDIQQYSVLGLLASSSFSDPNAPVVPWGTVLAGADNASHLGNLWSNDIGDALGTGLGLSGTGIGGGCVNGNCEGIGVTNIGGLGHNGLTGCTGPQCGDGHGFGHGPGGGGHVPHGPTMRQPTDLKTNGRLDSAIIQRIVRQNSGRMVACYQEGLRTNPALSGRVAVHFAIGREGDVTMSSDSSGSDLPNNDVRNCVVKSFYSISFPKPDSGIVTVTYPLTFSPAE